ncbi:MAG: TMEM175 family protein [Nostoc sp.]|uniref:IS4/Tn5 family transposase DNA-binding protein n=1 Tax=Nostoc sp. TaxID=1180 RepID=UPI002FF57600
MSRWWSKNFALSQLGDRRLNRQATEIGKILSQGFGATYFQVNRKGVPGQMGKGRLEAFSDGVIAIIITIMVLEIKVPHGFDLAALRPLIPVFLSYVLSFIFIGIYWNNHHHLLQAVRHVNGRILWANLHLLFWLSLIPFVTGWMGENHFAALPVALYGMVLLLAAIAFFILTRALIYHHGNDSTLAIAVGRNFKGKISVVFYALAIPLAFVNSWFACILYVLVAVMWLIPDRRIEKTLTP